MYDVCMYYHYIIECKKTNTFTDQQFRRKTQHLGGDEKRGDLLVMESGGEGETLVE